MAITIYFLGTGQAVPTPKRNHTSILLIYKNENILIDCGEGTQIQFRKAKLNPCKLTRILITHWHGDHILGLPGLLQTLALNNYSKTLKIYIPEGTKKFLDIILRMFVFRGKIKIEVHEIKEGIIIDEKDFYIEGKKMDHTTTCYAYSFIEKNKIKIDKEKMKKFGLKSCPQLKELKEGKDVIIDGKKIKAKELTYIEKGKKITFILDTALNEKCYEIAKNSDLLICESTYTQEEENLAKEYKHLTAQQAAKIAKKSHSKRLILTHISQRYSDEKILISDAKKIFTNTQICNDLDKIEI